MKMPALQTEVPPGALSDREAALRAIFLEEVDRIPGGDRLMRCIQCGTCSGSCPVSYAMDLQPRQLVALFRAGDLESIMRSRTIWICASCYSCTVRCPAGIKVTDLIYALKRMATAVPDHQGSSSVPLSESFVKILRRKGRNHELGLLARYFLKKRPLGAFTMLPLGWRLWRTKRLQWRAGKIEGVKDLQKIIARAEAMDVLHPKDLTKPIGDIGYAAITERAVEGGATT